MSNTADNVYTLTYKKGSCISGVARDLGYHLNEIVKDLDFDEEGLLLKTITVTIAYTKE